MLVEGHLHSVTCAAECDAEVNFSILNCRCELMCHIRIVHAGSGVCSEIHHFVALAGEVFYQRILVLHACVVVAYSDFHDVKF